MIFTKIFITLALFLSFTNAAPAASERAREGRSSDARFGFGLGPGPFGAQIPIGSFGGRLGFGGGYGFGRRQSFFG